MTSREISLTNSYLSAFFLEMHQLMEHNIGTVDALDIIKSAEDEKITKNWIARVEGYVAEGNKLSKALDMSGGVQDNIVYMIEAAEESNTLSSVMLELHKYYNSKINIGNKVKESITLPICLFIAMAAVVMLLISVVAPMFNNIVGQLSGELSTFGKALVSAGGTVLNVSKTLAIIVGILELLVGLLMAIPGSRKGIIKIWGNLLGNTGISKTLTLVDFTSNMSVLLASGNSIEKSFELTSKICRGSKKINIKLDECKKLIDEGKSIVNALNDTEFLDDRHIKMLRVAEKSNSLAETFRAISDEEIETSRRKIDTRLNIIEPTMMIIAGLLCGLILISTMLSVGGLMV